MCARVGAASGAPTARATGLAVRGGSARPFESLRVSGKGRPYAGDGARGGRSEQRPYTMALSERGP